MEAQAFILREVRRISVVYVGTLLDRPSLTALCLVLLRRVKARGRVHALTHGTSDSGIATFFLASILGVDV